MNGLSFIVMSAPADMFVLKEKERKLMIFHRRKICLEAVGFLMTMGILTGCGSNNEKTQEGMQSVRNLDYQGALAQFEEAQTLGENQRLIARGMGIAYMGLTDYEQAVNCFKEALTESDGFVENIDFDLNYYLAAAYTKNEQYAEAEAAYDAILALRPEEEDAYFLRGNVRLAQSDFDNAKTDFDKALSMDAGNYDRLIEVYQVLAYYGYQEAGMEYLQNVLESSEKQLDDYDMGRIYYYMGKYQESSVALEKAREKGGAESYLYLGRSYEATGEYNYAASVYNSYLAKDNQNAQVYNQLGLCEMARMNYQSALEAFQAGMQIENNGIMQTLSFNEIVAYEYLGEYQNAAILLDNYLKNYPDDEAAVREQQFLSTR